MSLPAQRADIKAHIQALADCVLGARVDRRLLEPALIATLSVDVNDFVRYHPVEFAELRVKDHEILLQHERFRPQLEKKASA